MQYIKPNLQKNKFNVIFDIDNIEIKKVIEDNVLKVISYNDGIRIYFCDCLYCDDSGKIFNVFNTIQQNYIFFKNIKFELLNENDIIIRSFYIKDLNNIKLIPFSNLDYSCDTFDNFSIFINIKWEFISYSICQNLK